MKYVMYPLLIPFIMGVSGCSPEATTVTGVTFPQISLTDTVVISAKWRSFSVYDHALTKALMRNFAAPEEALDDTTNCFAQPAGQFQVNQQDYYIVDWSDSLRAWGAETRLYVFQPDSNNYHFLTTLAVRYGSEGSDIQTASWIFDSDGDKQPELFTRAYTYYVTGDTSHCSDTISAYHIDKRQLRSFTVTKERELKGILLLPNTPVCHEK